ncbi:primosomal protein N' [Ligilactobacillus animalis]|uniref:Replication restart protein PriA n=1 Tax=Ligilactobacillus animalis TaxID=1605 RepID=A0AAJ6FX66_9LACO|nr:primosomal protein N' [Ligilactobacillus animalis]MDO5884223.1 primosomal protein N' [Ligilactobacillus animalis]MDU3188201.1 primosomal protein N' [Ligilactobacillus animalis]MDU8987519.1 primosomal protein N' [Ligilactobacillus animalis]THE19881.1 primosomal protein N' [Ligilactobacillus animalis]THE20502.1 primosomal protein N' [Ligilactobacillus animalis]
MARYAQVIVDVPAMQTNRPYTYELPQELQDQAQVGVRVIVPFGKGERQIQGFIVGLADEYELAIAPKRVTSLMDLAPVLNNEALQLADWLAQKTFSFKIRCLQVMLPNVMRASYSKSLRLLSAVELPQELNSLFAGGSEIEFDESKLSAQQLNKLAQMRQAGHLEVVYHVKDRAKAKLVGVVTSLVDEQNYTQFKAKVRKNAHKQLELLEFLYQNPHQSFLQTKLQADLQVSLNQLKKAAQQGWLKLAQQERYRDPYGDKTLQVTTPKQLTPEQQRAVEQIDQAITAKNATTFLLEGVTGSGKTEVYLQAIAHALSQGRSALMLVPEISLTPQMVQRVKERFGKDVAMLHSALSDGERYDEWRRIERKEAKVVVGARSAIFAPLDDLGLIIIDEEHEVSYKQEDMPRYQARDVALWRGKYHNCPVVLGSATPDLATRARAQKGVYQQLNLTKRINGSSLPQVTLVDMREAVKTAPAPDFSQILLDQITERLARKEQVVLMLNRRGYSSFVLCRDCGFVLKCPNCDVSLTLHMDTHSMKCHYCGHEEAIPNRCPSCDSKKIRYYGTGTQKVQAELEKLLPEARILRMDVDTTRKKGAHERLLAKFGAHEADILLGTQMIAKGLDFPDVTLVGVLNADTSLSLPDYRSSERTFQLLTQVSGRAGRADKTGQVVIQTYNPEHYAIQLACRQDYEQFFFYEMNLRHLNNYPPYYYTIKITVSAKSEAEAAKESFAIKKGLDQCLSPQALVLGPTPSSILKIKNRFYYQLVIKYKQEPALEKYLQDLLLQSQSGEKKGIMVVIDREPVNFL